MNELFRIINGALRLDLDKVRNYTAFLADRLEKEGDTTTASRLRKMLSETDTQLRPTDAKFRPSLPVDPESRFALIEKVNVRELAEPPVILSQDQWDVVHEFLSIAKSYAQLDTEGLGGAAALLMFGPPGTGKSRLARHLARELGLDLYIARLDGLISSFLGSTSKNIRALFDFAAKTPCVLFLDEFDAIAKLRGDTQEMGELKRVVNSFIQNLDTLGSQSIIIAATNHDQLLDSAVWRRFGYRIRFTYPSAELREQIWRGALPPIELSKRGIDLLVDLSEGFSGSDICEVCRRLNRRRISQNTSPDLKTAYQILQNMAGGEGSAQRPLVALDGKSIHDVAEFLRNRNKRLYSHSSLAELFGISKATAYRRAKGTITND